MRKRIQVLLTALVFAAGASVPGHAAWVQEQDKWFYEEVKVYVKDSWRLIDENWYYFGHDGYMLTGWQMINGQWYFFNPISDGTKGVMMTGWQWIDGKCYYLNPDETENYLKGVMYASQITPDGFLVNESGAWTDGYGNVQYVSGKGIKTTKEPVKTAKSISGGSGGGSNKGSSSSGKHEAPDREFPVLRSDGPGPEPDKPDVLPDEEKAPGEQTGQKYRYTIKYLNIENKTVLKVLAGEGQPEETITIDYPDLAGYVRCSGQNESFVLTADQMELYIYYLPVINASPSEARKVSWEVKFVEQDNHEHEIFKAQTGKSEENTELVIDFPETILGRDRFYYNSLVPSPWITTVNGTGIQKYYIEFRKGDRIEEEADPDRQAREKLERWLNIAKQADYELTGREPWTHQIITDSKQAGDNRLISLASAIDDAKDHEIYQIAKGYVPNCLIIGQTFDDIKNISELVMDEFSIEEERYTVLRIRFTRSFKPENCTHNYVITDQVKPECMNNGHETVTCKKCGLEETIQFPASGHVDADLDGKCEICYGDASQLPEPAYYEIGDVQARNIGGKLYVFRCIDDDYEDAMNNSQRTALFLCDTVIRSDIDSSSSGIKKLSFGTSNNYKYSDVRKWLQKNALDDQFNHNSYIGITQAYGGVTTKGAYEQFDQSSLTGYDREFQLMEDKIFCMSVDEAVKYREYLWRFKGSDINNPQSQISAYSKGYYLRSPQKGSGIYVVDLIDGYIHPAEVTSTDIGLRPVMTIPQNK